MRAMISVGNSRHHVPDVLDTSELELMQLPAMLAILDDHPRIATTPPAKALYLRFLLLLVRK